MPVLTTLTDPGTASWSNNQDVTAGALASDDNAAGNTNDVTIQTGNAVGDSGNISLEVGVAAANVGKAQFLGRTTTTDGVAAGTARVVGGLASTNNWNSNPVTNTAILSPFDVNYSIPADTLKAGSTVRVRAVVAITAHVGATTLVLTGRVGAAVVVTGSAFMPTAPATATVEFWVTTRAAPGAAVDAVGGGNVATVSLTPTASTLPDGTTLATNGALTVDITATWSAADGSSCTLESLIVDIF